MNLVPVRTVKEQTQPQFLHFSKTNFSSVTVAIFVQLQRRSGNAGRCSVSHDLAAVVSVLAATLQSRLGVVPLQIR